ncbi:hypothetical protein DL93DRAFT_1110489 [Clavulina sp. PMI_390]|nr:hypothetical protein DL93DRAFT_1110489 [Clavulina sp. PMI_390]
MQTLTRVLTVLQHSIPRWRTLAFGARTRAEVYAALLQFRQPAERLQSLSISASALGETVSAVNPPPRRVRSSGASTPQSTTPTLLRQERARMPPLFNGKTPFLQRLSLRTFAESIDHAFLKSLTAIHLVNGWATLSNFINALQDCSSTLEELSLITVDFMDTLWTPPPRDDDTIAPLLSTTLAPPQPKPPVPVSIKIPLLKRIRFDLPRSTIACLLSQVALPNLIAMHIMRTEESYEEWIGFLDVEEIPEAAYTPSTEDLLLIMSKMYREGNFGPGLDSFSLSYGSVLEVNAGAKLLSLQFYHP